MALNRTQARQLLTIPEFELFTQSRTGGLKALTPARLRTKIERTRALRDKFRDLYRRQTVATRADAAATNERTQRKAEVFEDILQRFESHLQQMDDDDAPPRARPSARAAPRKGADAAAAKTPARKRTTAARTAAQPAARGESPARAAAKPRPARGASADGAGAPAKRTSGRAGTRAPSGSAAAH
jgi:hypothetical protein